LKLSVFGFALSVFICCHQILSHELQTGHKLEPFVVASHSAQCIKGDVDL
jgi:hypothetical protein